MKRLVFLLVCVAGVIGGQTVLAQELTSYRLSLEKAVPAVMMDRNDQLRERELVQFEDGQLFYKEPESPRGVYANIDVTRLKRIEFPLEYDRFAVEGLAAETRWLDAARRLMKDVMPALRFIPAAPNNAADPAMDAGLYLLQEARSRNPETDEERQQLKNLLDRAALIFETVSRADWYRRSEEAALWAIQSDIEQGNLAEAGQRLQQMPTPSPQRPEAGVYWLTRGKLALAQDRIQPALDAAVSATVFENKNLLIFPPALFLSGQCYERLERWYRARDLYFETARLFPGTRSGRQSLDRLRALMSRMPEEKEEADVSNVFFGTVEDMDAIVRTFLKTVDETRNTE